MKRTPPIDTAITSAPFLVAVFLGLVPARGQQLGFEIDRAADLNGLLCATLTYPGEIVAIDLGISRDQEEFIDTGIDPLRDGDVLLQGDDATVVTTITVPLAANYRAPQGRFLFDQPGVYFIQWSIWDKEKGAAERVSVLQKLEVRDRGRDNKGFLAAINAVGITNGFIEDPVRQAENGDLEGAFVVVRAILQSMHSLEPIEGKHKSDKSISQIADSMWDLARGSGSSDYAPYAAYYAGACYVALLSEGADTRQLASSDAKKHVLFEKAAAALDFAAQRGDDYLQPPAIVQRARLHIRVGAHGDAEQLLNTIRQRTLGDGTVAETCNKLAAEIERQKRRAMGLGNSEPRPARP